MTENTMITEEKKNTTMNEGRFLVFCIGEEYYALKIDYITEIVEMSTVTQVPSTPDYLIGVINLRGTIVPLMDARKIFGYEDREEYGSRTCIVVLEHEGISVGLVIDAVQEVITLEESAIAEHPSNELMRADDYITGIGKWKDQVLLLIDCNKILDVNPLEERCS